RCNKQPSITKTCNNDRQQTIWRPLSSNRPAESIDPTIQESMIYKSQQRTNINDHKQRYQTINTAYLYHH
ncbi:unnamed protein product, partial [Adineta steineri]